MFWGLPNGIRDEPILAARETNTLAFTISISVILAIVNTNGINTKIAVSFIIKADATNTIKASSVVKVKSVNWKVFISFTDIL